MQGCTSCCIYRRRLETGQLCRQLWLLHLSPLCCCSWLLIVSLQPQWRMLILCCLGLSNPCILQYDEWCTYSVCLVLTSWCLTGSKMRYISPFLCLVALFIIPGQGDFCRSNLTTGGSICCRIVWPQGLSRKYRTPQETSATFW